ncbi:MULTISPECIES: L-threonylcarbamoyladenylate synthase [unclassified Neptuniibacter]|uniref:L-threonylcarbamoyladenylate synthase n=1 Tax=unclassified Neptuniibacter TaxID=2630693 RepID=UPI0026E2F92C|nr:MULTISPECIES: Sua5/YciO/YrdC/YwlC family protein [unclassified Neptuniibacter]MDO6514075.1 Sua5/YciO/YrdC/YwlC family protein [Neptuniibacter sp. 2_MG-2023]MDO6594088.1 Sua5/YciO/YrdC/YwlC family protein [Neptuniibacter sp. 1_MG-2023]
MSCNQNLNWWHIHQSVRAIEHGGVIAYPTEAVWGLGCDPFNQDAVSHLLKIKRRPVDKGLVLVAGNLSQIQFLLDDLSAEEYDKVTASWPGPYTWVLPDKKDIIPRWIKGKHSSVAVRVSDHLLVKKLTETYGSFIVSTSANPSAHCPAKDILRVNTYFGSELDYVLPGCLGGLSQPTQIKDLKSDRIVRV